MSPNTAPDLGFAHVIERGTDPTPLLRRPEILAGAALLRPTLRCQPDVAPPLKGTDVLIATGTCDPWVEPVKIGVLVEILSADGARATYSVTDVVWELVEADLAATGSWQAAWM